MIKILLIEDNESHLEITKNHIDENDKPDDIKIYTAQDLENGKKIITEEKIDCIFLDLGLPESKGIDTVKGIIKCVEKNNKDIPIVVYTSLEDYEIAKEAFKLGIKGFIIKGESDKKEIQRAINTISYKILVPIKD